MKTMDPRHNMNQLPDTMAEPLDPRLAGLPGPHLIAHAMLPAPKGSNVEFPVPPKLSCQKPAAPEPDDDEWEYEYSTTETETYYLTVDLSIPDFALREEMGIVHNTRGGYRSWFNPLMEKPDMKDVFEDGSKDLDTDVEGGTPKRSNGAVSEDDSADTDDEDDDDGKDEDNTGGNGAAGKDGSPDNEAGNADPRRKSKKRKMKNEEPLQIQIMDLHTDHPLIAHRGMVFTGTWAENIGTELVFSERLEDSQEDLRDGVEDEQDRDKATKNRDGSATSDTTDKPRTSIPSPAAASTSSQNKSLPYIASVTGATLLAASTARLSCRPATLTPRGLPQQRLDAHRAARAANKFVIHVNDDVKGCRRPQGSFLERLAAAKRRRGEADDVTVATIENPDDHVQDDSEEDFTREKKKRKQEEDELRRARLRGGARGSARGRGNKPRVRRNKGGLARKEAEAFAAAAAAATAAARAAEVIELSTPTPATWGEESAKRGA